MAAAQVDVPRLAAYVSLPVDNLNTLLTAPTADLTKLLLAHISQKAIEHENLAAAKLRVDVELENAVRSGEQKAQLMRTGLDKAQKQAAELRQQLDTEQTSRQSLAAELESVKSSTSSSGTELSILQQRISTLESSNRDTLALLESKSRAHDGLAQELSTKHQKTVELRKEVSDLEDKVRAAATAATGAKFREQALEQEVESLKRNNDYLENELKTKTAEHSKFRKDKNARIAELQRQHEEDTTTIESLQRADKALRTRTTELEQKAEDYLAQIQQVKEELTRQEENFRAEFDTANRLQELMKEQADTEKNRRADLQEQFETVQDEAREEFAKMEEEMNTMQQDKDTAEQRITELEAQIERLESDLTTLSAAPVTSTPRLGRSIRPGSGHPGSAPRTPIRGMSPSAPGSALRGSMNYTQLVTDFHEARKERDAYKRRSEELSEQIDSMMQELEQRRPALEQMTAEHSRLQLDVAEMSGLVESIGKERDAAKKESRNSQGQVKGLIREGDILRQQLRDLSSQIKVLLLEVNARDQGLDSITPDQRVRFEQLAKSQDVDREYNNDTDQFISQNLVAFKNIVELQSQNERLLRVTRELGEKMEGEEAQQQQTQAAQDHEEVQELRQKYDRLRDETKVIMTQSQSYIRERDIFRRMLSHRGQLPPQVDLESAFGQSVNGAPPHTPARNGVHASVELSPSSRDVADYTKLIKEMQNNFDGYKQEAATERTQLKDQVTSLTNKSSELRNEVARKSGEVLLATERYEMLQGNYTMLKTENGELQKRSQAASDRATQQDLRVQAVAEELVETRGLVESLRSESANLKAEKEFWKTIEKRLTDDNQSLITERDRLNTLNTNLQNLLNEREHSDHESRRRLQAQIETLESEIQTARRKLAETEEEAKRSALRREFDSQQAQTRIDDLVKSLSSTREELAGAKATRDQLQLRVDETTIELRSAEERLQLLSRPAPDGTEILGEDGTNQDQDLALQVSELKRDLELARRDLTSAEEQVEQYKEISQGSEEQLQSLNDSHDQYREEMDQLIEEKEAKIRELEATIENMRREADETSTEVESLRTEKAMHDQTLREQRNQLEAETARFKDAAERAETAAQFYQEDLQAQAEIARQAQENYEAELQKHAEASRAGQTIRTELNEVKLELIELRSAREAAQSGLSQAEDAWNDSKGRYEHELQELRIRRDDVSRQNKLLHEQLEKVNTQITELQRARVAGDGISQGGEAANGGDDGSLQELIRYLRREKEIVDVQYEMASRESKRFRQQLEQTQTQLEDARLKLNQQLRSEEERERSTLNHNKLIETINELNLLRESNATLRLEKNQAQDSLSERIKEFEDLHNQLQPLHAKVQELEDIRESQEQDLRMAREARERFEQRYHDLLTKTDSIDPAEFESLKESSGVLEAERDELKEKIASMQEQVDTIPAQVEAALADLREQNQASRTKLIEQAKARDSTKRARIQEIETSLQTATQEQQELQAQLENVRAELDTANEEKAVLQTQVQETQNAQAVQPMVDDVSDSNAQLTELQTQLTQANTTAESSAAEANELRQQLSVAQNRIAELEQELSTIRNDLTQAQSQPMAQPEPSSIQTSLDTEQLDKLREELAAARKDADALRTAAAANERAADIQEGEGQPSIADQIAQNVDAIRAELEARHEERVAAAEKRSTDRVQQMKDLLNQKMREYKATENERMKVEYEGQMQKLRDEHQKEVEQLEARHKSELEELKIHANAAGPNQEAKATTEPGEVSSLPPSLDSADDVKKLLQTSDVAKRILASNIQKKVAEAKELADKELEDKLSQAKAEATTAQETAVNQAREMEAKKQLVKLNMAQNQLKNAQVKVSYVQTSANDTPDRKVSEVWAIAKDMKPPSAVSGGLGKSTFAPSTNSSLATAQVQAPAQAAPQTSTQAPQAPAAAANPFVQAQKGPTPSATKVETNPAAQAGPAVENAPQKPAEAPAAAAPAPASTETQPSGAQPAENTANAQPAAAPARPASSLGRGRGGAQSALPVPGGRGQGRGSIPRGNHAARGRGARGGSAIPQLGAQANPALNATANQFVPRKRGLEGSEHAGPDKRQRGAKS